MATTHMVVKTFECPNDHTFKALVEYADRKATFKPISIYENGDRTLLYGTPMPLPVCPACSTVAEEKGFRRGKNQQVSEKEASAVAIHPQTGEVVYCFSRPDAPMPEMYKNEGFEKVQFQSYKSLENFCRERGMVNDIEGDWHHDDGYFEEDLKRRRKEEKELREWYREEREKAKKAGW